LGFGIRLSVAGSRRIRPEVNRAAVLGYASGIGFASTMKGNQMARKRKGMAARKAAAARKALAARRRLEAKARALRKRLDKLIARARKAGRQGAAASGPILGGLRKAWRELDVAVREGAKRFRETS